MKYLSSPWLMAVICESLLSHHSVPCFNRKSRDFSTMFDGANTQKKKVYETLGSDIPAFAPC